MPFIVCTVLETKFLKSKYLIRSPAFNEGWVFGSIFVWLFRDSTFIIIDNDRFIRFIIGFRRFFWQNRTLLFR